jgi:recombination associated protein RdgC
MFRNLRFVRFAGAWPESEAALAAALKKAAFTPCGPLTERSAGFEAPVETEAGTMCRSIAGADLVQLRSQSRLLPTSAVDEVLELRLDEYRDRTGEPPNRREKRRLKTETRDQLLPKALLRSERTKAFFLRSDNILAVDAGTPNKLEHFLEMLKLALGRFDADSLEYKRSIEDLLTRTFLGDPPPGIRLGRECRMQDPSDSKASVRFSDMDLSDPNVRKHVRDGLKIAQLGIEFGGALSCVIDEHGALSKLKLAGDEAPDTGAEENPLTRLDAEFVLLTGTVRQLLATLGKALGGPKA